MRRYKLRGAPPLPQRPIPAGELALLANANEDNRLLPGPPRVVSCVLRIIRAQRP